MPEKSTPPNDFNDLTGLRALGFKDDRYVIELDIHSTHHNVMGAVHGGVICTLLDAAMARAFLQPADAPQRQGATLEMKVNFLRGVVDGTLTAYGQLINSTRRTAFVEGWVENQAGQLVAKGAATLMLFENPNRK
ncbi:PaaI family thioesterase [Motiliproteus sp. SC1-56]|uniref:PaaI family thioesterase n=1 Tax=Motiliproteus sp. SC1-56 TaxID=2799565 RepID=UPI001A8D1D5D